MKTAYLINCHKNMKHVSRLAHRIHTQDSHIFIHVDKKVSDKEYNNLLLLTNDLEYCYISKTRIDARLDNRTLVDVVFVLVAEAKQFARKHSIHYSYFANISGQDYLIKPIKYIEDKLETTYPDIYMLHRDASYASFVSAKFNRNKCLIRYRDWALKCKISLIRKMLQLLGVIMRKVLAIFGQTARQRIIKKGWEYYQGPAWWVFPDCIIDAVEEEYYLQTELSKLMLEESTTPEETYFQCLVMHLFYSKFAKYDGSKMKIRDCMTYADFGEKTNRPMVFHPYILTMDDYQRLCKSDCWYARKFDDTVDLDVINKIDATLL